MSSDGSDDFNAKREGLMKTPSENESSRFISDLDELQNSVMASQ